MIIDKLTNFVVPTTDVVNNVGNALVGDVVDRGSAPTLKDLGNGQPVYLVMRVTTAFSDAADAGTATVQFQLCSDSTANLATSKTIHIDTGAIAIASLVAGYTKCYALPSEATYERYLGIWQTVGTTNLDAGAMEIFLSPIPVGNPSYPDSLTVATGQ